MKPRKILTATLVVALAAVPAALVAQPAFGGRGPGAHGGGFDGEDFHMIRGFLGRLGDKIGIDNAQRALIQEIADEEGPVIRGYFEQSRALRQEFTAANDPGSFDEQEFRLHAEEQARIQVEIKVASARAMSRVWAILTDEQKQELQELRELMGRRGRHGNHRGGVGAGSVEPSGS